MLGSAHHSILLFLDHGTSVLLSRCQSGNVGGKFYFQSIMGDVGSSLFLIIDSRPLDNSPSVAGCVSNFLRRDVPLLGLFVRRRRGGGGGGGGGRRSGSAKRKTKTECEDREERIATLVHAPSSPARHPSPTAAPSAAPEVFTNHPKSCPSLIRLC